MKCTDNCGYYWRDENEEYARCHFVEQAPGDKAPCEYDDYDEDDREDYSDEIYNA